MVAGFFDNFIYGDVVSATLGDRSTWIIMARYYSPGVPCRSHELHPESSRQ
jgi:hypothetical protein